MQQGTNHTMHRGSPQLESNNKPEPFYKSLTTTAWVSLATLVGTILFYLLTHHQKHVVDALPYILIIAMVFMHVGHGGHNHGGKNHG